MLSRLKRSGIDCLAGINCKDITSDVAGGTLPAMTSGEHEYIINTVGGTGTVTLGNTSTPAPTYTFPGGGNYIILVNGNLNIDTKITVPTTSTVLFSVSGNITVGSNVGDPLP